jgi:MazG family protein
VAFQVVLAEERGLFGAEDLTRSVERKMWRRHPHLFPSQVGDAGVHDEGTGHTWEQLKQAETGPQGPSVLEGLPPTLPDIIRAFRLQERAAGVGFDWADPEGPRAKVDEELEELDATRQARDARPQAIAGEIGDVLFAVVNLARKLGVDPRAALELANRKFERRFRALEVLALERGVEIGRAPLEDLDRLWDEVKRRE